jgi:transcription-repair coupling factor (superfamily II helicase)
MGLDFLRDVPEFADLVRELNKKEEAPAASGISPGLPKAEEADQAVCSKPGDIGKSETLPRLMISGISDSAKPYFFSFLAQSLSKPVVLVRPSDYSPAQFEERCGFFFSELKSAKHAKALPALDEDPRLQTPPPLETISSRMRFFYDLLYRPPALVITSLFGLLRPFPEPGALSKLFLRLEKNSSFGRDCLLDALSDYGYIREDLAAFRGEYAGRGGIVDVFSPWQSAPYRLEFSGDEIVSLREYDPSTQRSLRKLESVLVPSLKEPAGDGGERVPFAQYLTNAVVIIDRAEEVEKEWDEFLADSRTRENELRNAGKAASAAEEFYDVALWEQVRSRAVVCGEFELEPGGRSFHLGFQSVPRFANKIPFFLEYARRLQRERDRCYIFLSTPAIQKKIRTLLSEAGIESAISDSPLTQPRTGEIILLVGDLDHGFGFPAAKISFFAEPDIFTEEKVIVSRPAIKPSLTQFQDLRTGDYIVHVDYGIGLFQGLLKMDVENRAREFIELYYRDGDKLFVPVEDLNLVQKYSQVGAALPSLDKLGTNSWQKTKERTRKAVEKLARELLELYAQRKAVMGYTFSSDGEWQTEFEKTFEYEETEDQLRSIHEIKNDMENDSPMDRLLCGDVGYGKTEVAMRAAFKAVMDGKQVAVLCPTTVLASQHYTTFKNRLVLFPVRIEALTRLQSKSAQRKVVEDLKRGQVDVVVGTHRLLSKDVEFRDLGLLIIDEEQRFGVKHKEKIKQLKATIDVLALTATPIPRTLNLSLSGLRDISLIETPPKDRLAVHTVVTTFSPKLISSAVRQELSRGGQVYYIFNKIEEMEHMASLLQKWVPLADVVTVHGQMRPAELEGRMLNFIDRKYNVLVSTTIIENGIDIPLVNTLIVHRADRFGLAQLYQLRGRVGRSSRQAFAYFLVPPFSEMTQLAKQRLEALKEFGELGSGFRLALKDLEIRGAGNLFGSRQHGYMEAVGFDYFMHLLEQAIGELKGEAFEEVKTEINLRVDIRIPEEYIPQMNVRLNLYKRISSAESLDEVAAIEEEIRDRFGPPPPTVLNLCHYGRIKFLAQKLKVRAVDRIENRLVLKFMPETSAALDRMTRLLSRYSGSLTPQGVMSLALRSRKDEEILGETIAVLKEL